MDERVVRLLIFSLLPSKSTGPVGGKTFGSKPTSEPFLQLNRPGSNLPLLFSTVLLLVGSFKDMAHFELMLDFHFSKTIF